MRDNICVPTQTCIRTPRRPAPISLEGVLGFLSLGEGEAISASFHKVDGSWRCELVDKDVETFVGVDRYQPTVALYNAARQIRIRDVLRSAGAEALADQACKDRLSYAEKHLRKWQADWQLGDEPYPTETATGRVFDNHHFSEAVRHETGVGMSIEEIDRALTGNERIRKLDGELWELKG